MVKSLKKRLTLVTMMVVGIVVISIFSAICVLTYNSQLTQTIEFLEQEISSPFWNDHKGDKPPLNSNPLPGAPKDEFFELPNIYTFKVFVDAAGKISFFEIEDDSISEDLISNAVGTVLSTDKDGGRVSGASLIFAKKQTQGGTIIIFTSSKPIDTSLRNTALICLSLCIASLILFTVLVDRLVSYAIKPVEKAWNSQKQFIADASHDLKTPLTVILANNDILLSHTDETVKDHEKWIESTNEEALKMKSLVTQMLDLAKSEDISTGFNLEKTNLSTVTQCEILQFEPVAFEKQLNISSKIEENIYLNTNPDAYIRILRALLDNAIKYSLPNSDIKIDLRQERQGIVLLVNNQAYIGKTELAHIFERFYRADKSRSGEGYGLGLSIAKNLAIAIKADLQVTSNQMDGTTFALILKKK
ncbi:MAG: HAMP domain-containing histidine kinase [Ruminococcaceae bacterium]|nr:HAMP domain-containing histidine kinase [Oscillospiraceae bacterium]